MKKILVFIVNKSLSILLALALFVEVLEFFYPPETEARRIHEDYLLMAIPITLTLLIITIHSLKTNKNKLLNWTALTTFASLTAIVISVYKSGDGGVSMFSLLALLMLIIFTIIKMILKE